MFGEAKEFVSLVAPNVGRFPNVNNYACRGEEEGPCNDDIHPGETHYNKIRLDIQVEFTEYGWKQWSQITRSAEDAKIDLLCGGWPGSCEPSTAMFLKINQHEVLPEDRAVNPKCTNP